MNAVTPDALRYLSGFGSELASEALPGALPEGRNSPQRAPYGLYAEQFSGSAFTAPRHSNLRSWLYRIRPAAVHGDFSRMSHPALRTAPFRMASAAPTQCRWNPPAMPSVPTDFLDGLQTLAGGGDAALQMGMGIHWYCANRSMFGKYFYDADGELLLVPQRGRMRLHTEMGLLDLAPGELAVIPRGLRFRVQLLEGEASGYVCENYGAPLRLPELGPIGANGLANARDFQYPVAAFEDLDTQCRLVAKFGGQLWGAELDHCPLDVVAWHGNYAPYKYDMARFNALNTVSFDHPDPSIFTVLTSPSDTPGTANLDFVIFPPRWMVAEDTFRPPWFHRNVMSEFMGLIHGVYDAKTEGFLPGGASLHNCMTGHGPDAGTDALARDAHLTPLRPDQTLAFMFESRYVIQPAPGALALPSKQPDYANCWRGLPKRFTGEP